MTEGALKLVEHGGSGGDSVSDDRAYRNRKPRSAKKYDAAMVALLAAKHVPEAIKTIAALVKSADRDSVRLKASTTMIELACGLEASDDDESGTKVYVLATSPDQQVIDTEALRDELRRRLQK
jgi:hypothetical protein